MKVLRLLPLIVWAFFFNVHSPAQVVLSDFSNLAGQNPTFEGSWRGGSPIANQYVQNSGFISIQSVSGGNPLDDASDFFVTPSTFSIGSFVTVSVTAKIDTGNAASSFKLLLQDGNFKTEVATFSLASFNGSFSTQTSTLSTTSGFDSSHIVLWQIVSGNPGNSNAFRVSFDNAAVVPEPSTFALLGLGLAGALAARRHRR